MFRKSYFYTIIVLIIIGLISMFISFSDAASGFRDRVAAVFSPDYTGTIYLDIGSDYIDNIDGESAFSGRSQFKLTRLVDKTSINEPVICDNMDKFDEYSKLFKHENVFANMTVASFMKMGNVYKRGEYVSVLSEYSSYDRNKYRECDLGVILKAYIDGKTWNDIGYISEDNIVIVLPPEDSSYYKYVVAQLFVAFNDDNTLTEADIDKNVDNVKKIVDNALTYSSGMDFENNYIFIGCEQGSIFRELVGRSKMESVYFNKAVYPDVKIFYNDEPINEFIEEQTVNCDNNVLVSNCGYRFTNNDNYSGRAKDNSERYWNLHSPNVINRCTVENWPYIDHVFKNLEK